MCMVMGDAITKDERFWSVKKKADVEAGLQARYRDQREILARAKKAQGKQIHGQYGSVIIENGREMWSGYSSAWRAASGAMRALTGCIEEKTIQRHAVGQVE